MRVSKIRRNSPLSESGITEVPRERQRRRGEEERAAERWKRETDKQKAGNTQREMRDGREFKAHFSQSWTGVMSLLLRIRGIYFITGCVHTHTEMCHLETLLAPKVGTGDAQQPWGGTTGPIQMKNRVISLFPHLVVSTMWKWLYWS